MASKSNGCSSGPRCCCGSNNCAFLEHNGRLLEGLERDVSKAAQLGQALLIRHEAYVADSESERRHMIATIENLEMEKLALEAKNAETIKANRDLLDQLEQLNDSVGNSDSQILALTNTLRSTEEELQRLGSLAARTQLLERQLIDLEREQSHLQTCLDTKTVDERTAMQRWKSAERTLVNLQDQIDRIEKEARAERDRHLEVVARMERRMAVEGELHTPADKLKAKPGRDKGSPNVVSHFVKDILLDNANLQHGILELREMLVNSNEEVEHLREQLKYHQPVPSSPTAHDALPTLQKELEAESGMNQELHIHHHYHGPKPAKHPPKAQLQSQRRQKKKRFSLNPSHFEPFPPQLDRSSTATILSQTAASVPNSHRWSSATTLAPSSLPSSPSSDSPRGSGYDRVFSDAAYDSSRPTSPPDSIYLQSPIFDPVRPNDYCYDPDVNPRRRRRTSTSLKPPSLSTICSASTPINMTAKSSPATAIVSAISPANSFANDVFMLSPALPMHPGLQSAIPEEGEDVLRNSASLVSPEEEDDFITPVTPTHSHRSVRRHTSHDSLISVHGMDIHTLQSRPSQLLIGTSSCLSGGSVGPELTPWTATAHVTLSRTSIDINRALLVQQRAAGPRKSDGNGSGIGKKVGGWVFGKWGATPVSDQSRPTSSHSQSSQATTTTTATAAAIATATTVILGAAVVNTEEARKKDKLAAKLRPSGVNQSGAIWGFFDIPETPTSIVVEDYDAEALGEALAEC